MMFRPMPILTVLTFLSLMILLQLGNWQYARYTSKIERSDPVARTADVTELTVTLLRENAGNLQQINGMADSEFIWRRYAPARLEGSDETILVLVDATGGVEQVAQPIDALPETLSFSGRLVEKTAERSWFGQADNPGADTWYRLDAPTIGAHLGYPEITRVAEPVRLFVTNSANTEQRRETFNPYALDKPIDPLPPERHFGYALTWWGMAIGLLGVYIVLHQSRGRLRFRKSKS